MERWKLFRHGYYEISSYGRARRVKASLSNRSYSGRMLKPHPARDYVAVTTSIDGVPRHHFVHILVAKAFIGSKPEEGMEVNHKDLDKTNNYYKNLEWLTPSGNRQHALKNGVKMAISKHEDHSSAKLSIKQVKKIRKLFATGNYTKASLSRRFDIGTTAIRKIVTNMTWVGV